jgi:hypothetical protein
MLSLKEYYKNILIKSLLNEVKNDPGLEVTTQEEPKEFYRYPTFIDRLRLNYVLGSGGYRPTLQPTNPEFPPDIERIFGENFAAAWQLINEFTNALQRLRDPSCGVGSACMHETRLEIFRILSDLKGYLTLNGYSFGFPDFASPIDSTDRLALELQDRHPFPADSYDYGGNGIDWPNFQHNLNYEENIWNYEATGVIPFFFYPTNPDNLTTHPPVIYDPYSNSWYTPLNTVETQNDGSIPGNQYNWGIWSYVPENGSWGWDDGLFPGGSGQVYSPSHWNPSGPQQFP